MILDSCLRCSGDLDSFGACVRCGATGEQQHLMRQVEQERTEAPKVKSFCNLCGMDTVGQAYDYCLCGGMLMPATPISKSVVCAECLSVLDNYACPKCDAELIRDVTTEYHPYLWEMEMSEQISAHALGVAL
jgi:hypothetical protein